MREAEELAKVFAEIDVMLSWDGGRGFDNFWMDWGAGARESRSGPKLAFLSGDKQRIENYQAIYFM